MKVLKFSGSSVGTPERISGVIDISKKYQAEGGTPRAKYSLLV